MVQGRESVLRNK